MGQGTVFQIQSYSIHDGPGIRTTVFVKGCPLRCLWCHNPESQRIVPEVFFLSQNCTGCGTCAEHCPMGAIRMIGDQNPVTDRKNCTGCGTCVLHCRQKARRISGETADLERIMERIRKDALFYPLSGGGVTVSGGEPLACPELTLNLLKACKEEGYHTAMETCGYAPEEIVKQILPYADLVFLDLKAMDPKVHRKLTGVTNEVILKNAITIREQRRSAGKDQNMVIRIPMVKGCNTDEDNLRKTGQFIAEKLGCEIPLQLLPYHNLGVGKEKQLERENVLEFSAPSTEELEWSRQLLEGYGLSVQIGGSM